MWAEDDKSEDNSSKNNYNWLSLRGLSGWKHSAETPVSSSRLHLGKGFEMFHAKLFNWGNKCIILCRVPCFNKLFKLQFVSWMLCKAKRYLSHARDSFTVKRGKGMDVRKKLPQNKGVLGHKHPQQDWDVISPKKNPLTSHRKQSHCEESPWKECPVVKVLARFLRGLSPALLLGYPLSMWAE